MNTDEILLKIQKLSAASIIPPKSSAVVIPLIEFSDEPHILFEQRSKKLSFQPGEVCFPGGRIEINELPEKAAIRELCEELLLSDDSFKESPVALSPLTGPTGAPVFPFVVLLNNYDMTFSSDEVEKVFTYPISFFKEHPSVRYGMQKRTIPPENFPYELVTGGQSSYNWHVQNYDMWIYEDTSPVIWGFTGRLLHSFLELVL